MANERLDALTDGVNSVNEAYKVLGLTTRAEAAKQAEAYTQAYGIIKKDGEATAGQLIDGFKKYAKAAVAANGDVVTAQLKTEAAQRGLTIAVDETGRVTFQKMGEAKEANDRVTRSVGNIRTAYDGISSSAGSAGNAMVRAANEASSAYDKLQAKIKAVKEAQAVKNADETLKNLRIYGKEEAPVMVNQFGTRLGVENFLKSQGLSEEAAIEETRKLYAKAGKRSGALNFGELQGYGEGRILTNADLGKFKTASMYLAEIAEKARQNERRDSQRRSKISTDSDYNHRQENEKSQSAGSYNEQAYNQRLYDLEVSAYQRQWEAIKEASKKLSLEDKMMLDTDIIPSSMQSMYDKLNRLSDSVDAAGDRIGKTIQDTMPDKKGGYLFDYLGTPSQVKSIFAREASLPQSALDAVANLSKTPNFDASKGSGPVKTIKLDLSFGGKEVSTEMQENQESALMALLQQLQDSKAIAGY